MFLKKKKKEFSLLSCYDCFSLSAPTSSNIYWKDINKHSFTLKMWIINSVFSEKETFFFCMWLVHIFRRVHASLKNWIIVSLPPSDWSLCTKSRGWPTVRQRELASSSSSNSRAPARWTSAPRCSSTSSSLVRTHSVINTRRVLCAIQASFVEWPAYPPLLPDALRFQMHPELFQSSRTSTSRGSRYQRAWSWSTSKAFSCCTENTVR